MNRHLRPLLVLLGELTKSPPETLGEREVLVEHARHSPLDELPELVPVEPRHSSLVPDLPLDGVNRNLAVQQELVDQEQRDLLPEGLRDVFGSFQVPLDESGEKLIELLIIHLHGACQPKDGIGEAFRPHGHVPPGACRLGARRVTGEKLPRNLTIRQPAQSYHPTPPARREPCFRTHENVVRVHPE